MDKETYEALLLIRSACRLRRVDEGVRDDEKEAWRKIDEWIDEVAKDYDEHRQERRVFKMAVK